jgi:hypothetical protein
MSIELKELYRLKSYRAIGTPKHRKYVELILIDLMSPSRAASTLTLNTSRLNRDEAINACLREVNEQRDPTGRDRLYELANRIHQHLGRPILPPDPAWANEALEILPDRPGVWLTAKGQIVDRNGNPLPHKYVWQDNQLLFVEGVTHAS